MGLVVLLKRKKIYIQPVWSCYLHYQHIIRSHVASTHAT